MALVLTYTKKVRQALQSPVSLGVDVVLLVGIAGLIAALAASLGRVEAPIQQHVDINLSLWALPKYTLMSLGRGFAAYGISLVFTLVYGTIAAHNHMAEKIMLPALDILQSIPVLGFMPGLVLAMIGMFHQREIGLELACVIMIFTAQAWNMTFSFHGSLRSIPSAMREAAALQGLSGWQIFRILEVPASMIGLVWNSLMSMAGGWFFLTVNEAFELKINGQQYDFRLPGIGSYMSQAIDKNNHVAQVGAVVAMVLMIVIVDQFFWRPIVVWSQKFAMGDSAAVEYSTSWIVDLLHRSRLLIAARRAIGDLRQRAAERSRRAPSPSAVVSDTLPKLKRATSALAVFVLAIVAAWGAIRLLILLVHLPLHDPSPVHMWTDREDWITVLAALLASFIRTSAAVLISAVWALPAGIVIGLSPRWSRRLQPITQVLASFPAPMLFAWVYIAMLFMHVPFTVGCGVLMLLGAQWYVLFNVIAGASAIPPELKEATVVYNLSRVQRWRQLYLPCVFPYLVTGLITAAGGAWNATIVSEALTVGDHTIYAFGLGSIISQAAGNDKYALLAAAVVTMSVFVVLLNRIIWKRLYRLAESRYSLNV